MVLLVLLPGQQPPGVQGLAELGLLVESPSEIPSSLLGAKNIRTKIIFRVFKGLGFQRLDCN